MTASMSRRDFVRTGALASGLVLAVQLPAWARGGLGALARTGATLSPGAFLQITGDGIITVWLTKSEMGQGIRTVFPMIVAEELEVPVSAIQLEQAPAEERFGEQYTWASSSVSDLWTPLRTTAAQAREMLLGAAARTWGVPAAECRAEAGAVLHAGSGRRASYGELVPVAMALAVPSKPVLKEPASFSVLGKATHRVDTPSKVDGSARFGLDVRLPGMLYACVARCPIFGRNVSGYEDAGARAIPGVRDIVPLEAGELVIDDWWLHRLPGAVAVVADTTWAAIEGCRALGCRWDESLESALDSEKLRRIFKDRATQQGTLGRNEGDAPTALEQSARIVEAVYEAPFQAHATMEPMNCTADVRPGRCDIYAPTQYPSGLQRLAEKLTGLPASAVTVHTTLMGGGFGRRSEMHWVIDAIRVSSAIHRPVQIVWTREHDIQHDNYRPASYHVLKGGLDAAGRIIAWTHRMVAPSVVGWHAPSMLQSAPDKIAEEALDGAADLPYGIPNIRVDYCPVATPVPLGWWRSVYASQNCFANESFMDELADAVGRDPFEVRRELLAEAPRHRRVLELAAEKAGWGRAMPAGHGRGIAVHRLFSDTVAAEVAEVSVENGAVQVHRVVCAVDCGFALNPDTVAAQMEGGVVYGLSAALTGQITLEGGRVKQSNFNDYPLLRMKHMPKVEVHLVTSTDTPRGVGEPSVPPIAPAVANAIRQATGTRLRSMPLTLS
jgi:isoquinoline 1-oxidoreductase beta subunit